MILCNFEFAHTFLIQHEQNTWALARSQGFDSGFLVLDFKPLKTQAGHAHFSRFD
jgi:hypothetical protein